MFAAIAGFWLVYLVPTYLQQRGGPAREDTDIEIPASLKPVTVVRTGDSLAAADPGSQSVSTPLTRRSALRELEIIDQQAALRRRRVLIVLLAIQFIAAALAGFGIGPWWTAAIPAGLLVVFLVVARFSVRRMRAGLAERARQIRCGAEEETVALDLSAGVDTSHEHSVELSRPAASLGSLWDPVPITRPTYVSQPLAPRTVRTIDLAAPVAAEPVPIAVELPAVAESADEREVG